MKKLLALLFLLPISQITSIAQAADNAVTLTAGSGVIMRTRDIGAGVQSPYNILGDIAGAAIYGTAGAANTNVITVQGIASGVAQPVTMTSTTITGTVAATQSGTWTVQPGNTANTTAWLVTGTGGTFPATQSGTWTVQPGNTANTTPWLSSISQGGNTASVKAASTAPIATDPAVVVSISPNSINANGQATMAASAPVAIASNQSAIPISSSDPCLGANKTNLPISQNGTSSVQLIALSGATVVYVCSLSLIAAGATTVAITTGTGSACVTSNAAVIGSTTANIANSLSLAANGGLTLGNGLGTIAKGAASSELCMINGTNVFVSGNLTYVQQ